MAGTGAASTAAPASDGQYTFAYTPNTSYAVGFNAWTDKALVTAPGYGTDGADHHLRQLRRGTNAH